MINGDGVCTVHIPKPLFTKITGIPLGQIPEQKVKDIVGQMLLVLYPVCCSDYLGWPSRKTLYAIPMQISVDLKSSVIKQLDLDLGYSSGCFHNSSAPAADGGSGGDKTKTGHSTYNSMLLLNLAK